MTQVIGKEKLCSTDLKYFKAVQGIDGKTLFDRYPALANVVNSNIDAKYRDFLAYPVQEGNTITFHGKKYNETPRLLSELQGDDWAKYINIKDETLAHYNNKIDFLRNSGKTTEAEFLAGAVKYVDDRVVYCYDDRVVLGVWGMCLRDHVKEDIREICKDLTVKIPKPPPEPEIIPPPSPPPASFTVTYNAGDNGTLNGNSVVNKRQNDFLSESDIPQVEPKEGYEFAGWDKNPNDYEVTGDTEFTAQYHKIPAILLPPPLLPWWKRFGLWFTGKGCLKWLLWLLLALLLLLLLLWLLKSCNHYPVGGGALGDNDSTWLREDPARGHAGGIYDPYNPYQPAPVTPGYGDVLPPEQGVLPPMEDEPEIIPGNPSIIANRLNILMENKDKSILDLAKDFKTKYPNGKYRVVYYDDVIKRMQIEIPKEEREQLKQSIPEEFAPAYELFVFDEALFEGAYTPDDPAFADPGKAWYLNAVHAPQAWDITRGSEKITVAIVDNGFNLKHPELSGKVVQPYNVWTHSDEIFPQQVDHGTHVAGTALAVAGNGKGLCGIAPNCRFMPVQVADKRGMMTTTSALDGILYALYQGADVVNVSLGSQFTGLSQFPESAQQELIRNYFKEEERLWREIMRIAASHNSTIVVAAGNDNVLAGIEALQRPELFITVSAVDKNSQSFDKAGFSNYGPFSTVSAPGVDIYSSTGKNDYQAMTGTSMAAPIVAGAVALMKSMNDTITTKQIICILQSTGMETRGNIGKLIQLDKALEKVKSGEECVEPPSPCNATVASGGDEGYVGSFEMEQQSGSFVFAYNTQNVPDKITIYDGIDTKGKIIFTYEGSTRTPLVANVQFNKPTVTVEIIGGERTYWEFLINCPGENFEVPSAAARRSQLEQERDRLQQELDRVNNELRRIGNSR